jgi:hypothetical protein
MPSFLVVRDGSLAYSYVEICRVKRKIPAGRRFKQGPRESREVLLLLLLLMASPEATAIIASIIKAKTLYEVQDRCLPQKITVCHVSPASIFFFHVHGIYSHAPEVPLSNFLPFDRSFLCDQR